MKKRILSMIILLTTSLVLFACQAVPGPTTTALATASATAAAPTDSPATELPSATKVFTPTVTSQPTEVVTSAGPTPTNAGTPVVTLSRFTNWQGGYGFEVTPDLWVGIKGRQTVISSTVYAVSFALYGVYGDYAYIGAEPIAKLLLENFFGNPGTTWRTDPAESITVDGVASQAIPFRGLLNSEPVSGKVIVIQPEPTRYISILGMGSLQGDDTVWKTSGERILSAILSKLTILPKESLTDKNTCSIAQDHYYGTSLGSPIHVGGGNTSGPARERAYLDNLLGSDNQAITYEFVESKDSGGTTLDIYQVTSAGQHFRLFFDTSEYLQPYVPYGFNCRGAFPFDAPAE